MLTSQNSGTRVLDCSQAQLNVSWETVPKLLWNQPGTEMSRVVAERITIFGAGSTG